MMNSFEEKKDSTYLSKNDCYEAKEDWQKRKQNFETIKELIDPTHVFKFTHDDLTWIRTKNKYHSFHAHAGVHNKNFILIICPLDKHGVERDLHKYLYVNLEALKDEIILTQTDVVTTEHKIILSKDLEVNKLTKEVNFQVYNDPTILELTTVKDIKKWKYDCFNWFYNMICTSKVNNIFKYFSVPSIDIGMQDQEEGDITALFGLRLSEVFQELVPILIFVTPPSPIKSTKSNGDEISSREVTSSTNGHNSLSTNTRDWSRPTPPYWNWS